MGAGVLLVAATLAGIAQGRGQPLPAQEGSVLAGPAFANAVVAGGLARVALSPAAPGLNRLTVLTPPPVNQGEVVPPPPSDAAPGETPRHLATETTAGSISATLACICFPSEITVDLFAGDGAWHADIDLPAAGVWRATLTVDGAARPGPGRLAGRQRPCPRRPAGGGGLPGRPVRPRRPPLPLLPTRPRPRPRASSTPRAASTAARWSSPPPTTAATPRQARVVAERLLAGGAKVAAPCGGGSGAATEALSRKIPVVVSDPQAPVVPSTRVFRLAPDPYAEGGRWPACWPATPSPSGPMSRGRWPWWSTPATPPPTGCSSACTPASTSTPSWPTRSSEPAPSRRPTST